ncbi:hypothetical protein VP01_557g3 [Puccinia sorghi]|uniref:Uncharacterized protein n=1 Tax=Puccinia sorghi TaxID=27349 RepID=A0A0L6UJ36_9BASI|nr:hypothetical protein VP01_557g3 [Puccinia sorghi]
MVTDQSKNIFLNHVQAFLCKNGQDKKHLEGDLVTEVLQDCKVASESNKRFANAGPLIRDATRTGVAPIECHIYLLQSLSLPEFSKDSQYLITNQASSSHRIKAVAALCKDKVFGFQLKMESPGAVESQATAAAEAQNHLCRNQGASNKPNHVVSPSPFEDLVNLYKEHLPKKKYESKFPVFVDPCHSKQYILFTISAMQTWAHSLVSCALFFSFFFQSTDDFVKIFRTWRDGQDSPQAVPSSDSDDDDSSGAQSSTNTMNLHKK